MWWKLRCRFGVLGSLELLHRRFGPLVGGDRDSETGHDKRAVLAEECATTLFALLFSCLSRRKVACSNEPVGCWSACGRRRRNVKHILFPEKAGGEESLFAVEVAWAWTWCDEEREAMARVEVSVEGESSFSAVEAAGSVSGATSFGDLEKSPKQAADAHARVLEAERIEVALGASKEQARRVEIHGAGRSADSGRARDGRNVFFVGTLICEDSFQSTCRLNCLGPSLGTHRVTTVSMTCARLFQDGS